MDFGVWVCRIGAEWGGCGWALSSGLAGYERAKREIWFGGREYDAASVISMMGERNERYNR